MSQKMNTENSKKKDKSETLEQKRITHIKECKKIYRPLMCLNLEEAHYVKNEWEHACFSAYNIIPSENTKYDDLDVQLTMEEIQDIINAYGIEPPSSHWYWNELTNYMYNMLTEFNYHKYLEKSMEKIENALLMKEDTLLERETI